MPSVAMMWSNSNMASGRSSSSSSGRSSSSTSGKTTNTTNTQAQSQSTGIPTHVAAINTGHSSNSNASNSGGPYISVGNVNDARSDGNRTSGSNSNPGTAYGSLTPKQTRIQSLMADSKLNWNIDYSQADAAYNSILAGLRAANPMESQAILQQRADSVFAGQYSKEGLQYKDANAQALKGFSFYQEANPDEQQYMLDRRAGEYILAMQAALGNGLPAGYTWSGSTNDRATSTPYIVSTKYVNGQLIGIDQHGRTVNMASNVVPTGVWTEGNNNNYVRYDGLGVTSSFSKERGTPGDYNPSQSKAAMDAFNASIRQANYGSQNNFANSSGTSSLFGVQGITDKYGQNYNPLTAFLGDSNITEADKATVTTFLNKLAGTPANLEANKTMTKNLIDSGVFNDNPGMLTAANDWLNILEGTSKGAITPATFSYTGTLAQQQSAPQQGQGTLPASNYTKGNLLNTGINNLAINGQNVAIYDPTSQSWLSPDAYTIQDGHVVYNNGSRPVDGTLVVTNSGAAWEVMNGQGIPVTNNGIDVPNAGLTPVTVVTNGVSRTGYVVGDRVIMQDGSRPVAGSIVTDANGSQWLAQDDAASPAEAWRGIEGVPYTTASQPAPAASTATTETTDATTQALVNDNAVIASLITETLMPMISSMFNNDVVNTAPLNQLNYGAYGSPSTAPSYNDARTQALPYAQAEYESTLMGMARDFNKAYNLAPYMLASRGLIDSGAYGDTLSNLSTDQTIAVDQAKAAYLKNLEDVTMSIYNVMSQNYNADRSYNLDIYKANLTTQQSNREIAANMALKILDFFNDKQQSDREYYRNLWLDAASNVYPNAEAIKAVNSANSLYSY